MDQPLSLGYGCWPISLFIAWAAVLRAWWSPGTKINGNGWWDRPWHPSTEILGYCVQSGPATTSVMVDKLLDVLNHHRLQGCLFVKQAPTCKTTCNLSLVLFTYAGFLNCSVQFARHLTHFFSCLFCSLFLRVSVFRSPPLSPPLSLFLFLFCTPPAARAIDFNPASNLPPPPAPNANRQAVVF